MSIIVRLLEILFSFALQSNNHMIYSQNFLLLLHTLWFYYPCIPHILITDTQSIEILDQFSLAWRSFADKWINNWWILSISCVIWSCLQLIIIFVKYFVNHFIDKHSVGYSILNFAYHISYQNMSSDPFNCRKDILHYW
jgi:hypothetical protein